MLLNSSTNSYTTIRLSTPTLTHLRGYKSVYSSYPNSICHFPHCTFKCISDNFRSPIGIALCCRARRRVRYEDDDEEDDESYGYNEEIAVLEFYSQSRRDEALLVTATVDDQEAEVLIFKGFSSCLSYKTSPDPSRSVLPQRAKIKLIDRIKGPFNPNNIEYIEKSLTWETFRSRFAPTSE